MSNQVVIVLLTSLSLAASACSGGTDPFCGDGDLNPGEECDDGNTDDTDFCLSTCKARVLSQLTVKWEFNKEAAQGFTSDTCMDMEAELVEVELVGGPQPLVKTGPCSFHQVVFVDIPAADYQIKVKVLDAEEEGVMLTGSIIEQAYSFPGGNEITEVVVPYDAWSRSYTGTFFFRLSWGGADCAVAVPPVVKQRLTLVADGQTFTGSTTNGAALDGSATSPCVSLMETFPESALAVPFGPATWTVQGLDAMDVLLYESVFETFVGAGEGNPEPLFDVLPLPAE